jgi:hypothetical protein
VHDEATVKGIDCDVMYFLCGEQEKTHEKTQGKGDAMTYNLSSNFHDTVNGLVSDLETG